MNRPAPIPLRTLAATCLSLLGFLAPASAATTINVTNHLAYGANIGWIDWRSHAATGATLTDFICSGYLYSANVGWLHLGNGTPANGIQYQNNSATDFGVNVDSSGNLRGSAYGANIGWIQFEASGAPRVDLCTGRFSGACYSANCGWISLSNTVAHVQTDALLPGSDTDGDGLADAWELQHFGSLAQEGAGDADGDGASNAQEHLAGTDPTDATRRLVITNYAATTDGTNTSVSWQSVPSRHYFIEQTLDLNSPFWTDLGIGQIPPAGSVTTRTFTDTNAPMRFLRVRAVKPLAP